MVAFEKPHFKKVRVRLDEIEPMPLDTNEIDGFVGFADISGFTKRVRATGGKDPLILLDFYAAAKHISGYFPQLQVRVFSDSCLAYGRPEQLDNLVRFMAELVRSCYADEIPVRAGIAPGSVTEGRTVDPAPSNFQGRLIYGTGIVEAVEICKAGRGARVFLHKHAFDAAIVAKRWCFRTPPARAHEVAWELPDLFSCRRLDICRIAIFGHAIIEYVHHAQAGDDEGRDHWLQTMEAFAARPGSKRFLRRWLRAMDAPTLQTFTNFAARILGEAWRKKHASPLVPFLVDGLAYCRVDVGSTLRLLEKKPHFRAWQSFARRRRTIFPQENTEEFKRRSRGRRAAATSR